MKTYVFVILMICFLGSLANAINMPSKIGYSLVVLGAIIAALIIQGIIIWGQP